MRRERRRVNQSLTSVILISIIGLILILEIGSAAIGYYEFTVTIESQYDKTGRMLANAGANVVDPDMLDYYLLMKARDHNYHVSERRLQNLVDASESLVMYIAKVDLEEMHREYIYDVVGRNYDTEKYELGYINDITEAFADGYRKMLNDVGMRNFNYRRTTEVGSYTTTIAPVYNTQGEVVAVCGVVIMMTELTRARKNFVRQLAIWTVILSVLAGSGWFYMMRKRLVLPLRVISEEALRFAEEPVVADVPLTSRVDPAREINDLAGVVDRMEQRLVDNLTQLLNMTEERNRISAELNIATKIQSNNLPSITENFPGRTEMDVAAYMKPAKEVGGDFYDFFFIDEDHFALVIADVSGKGVPAALFMMISKVLIKTTCMGAVRDPGEVLTEVNRKLCENNEIDMFVTAWLGIMELSTGRLVCSNAGHEYPVLGGAGTMEIYKDRHGFVLGGMPTARQRSYEIQMKPGDFIFVYTDGVAESINAEKEQFGTERLVEVLNRDPDLSPSERIAAVNESIEHFIDGEDQFDDTTMLCVRYNGAL